MLLRVVIVILLGLACVVAILRRGLFSRVVREQERYGETSLSLEQLFEALASMLRRNHGRWLWRLGDVRLERWMVMMWVLRVDRLAV